MRQIGQLYRAPEAVTGESGNSRLVSEEPSLCLLEENVFFCYKSRHSGLLHTGLISNLHFDC